MREYKDSTRPPPADSFLIDDSHPPAAATESPPPPEPDAPVVAMSSHSQSPQRNRKPAAYANPTPQGGQAQPAVQREPSPSPSFRDRQRQARTQSMPIVAPLSQIHPAQQQQQQQTTAAHQQSSPTISNPSLQRRKSSPPLPAAAVGLPPKPSPPTYSNPNARERTPNPTPPPQQQVDHRPPLAHSHTFPNVNPNLNSNPNPNPNHTPPQLGYPRPIQRVPPPQFLASGSRFQSLNDVDNWQMTEELMAEIERADMEQSQGHTHFLPAPHASHPIAIPLAIPISDAPGTSGVAYAGGVTSSGQGFVRFEAANVSAEPPKGPIVERVRVTEERVRVSPRDTAEVVTTPRKPREREQPVNRDSPKKFERAAPPGPTSFQHLLPHGQSRTPERSGSPAYHTPMASPGEHAASYTQYEREHYPPPAHFHPPMMAQVPTPPSLRKASNVTPPNSAGLSMGSRATPPSASKLSTQSQNQQQSRTPDRSLPVQEEAEEEVSHAHMRERRGTITAKDYARQDREGDRLNTMHGSPTPSSDIHPGDYATLSDADNTGRASRAEHRPDDEDDDTLNELEQGRQHQDQSASEEEEAFTPRSPMATLPEPHGLNHLHTIPETPHTNGGQQPRQTIPQTKRHRTGATDQLGLSGFDPSILQTAMRHLGDRRWMNDEPHQHQQREHYPTHDPLAAYFHPPQVPQEDLQSFFDDAAYLHAYLQSPTSTHARPNAPVPPTPHTHTAAPSPSPLVSGMPSDSGPRPLLPPYSPAPPGGTPYPHPFSHVRRNTYAAPPTHNHSQAQSVASGGRYDPTNPRVIQEQLQLQLQMYALNNGLGAVSDSTLSPSASPYPGAGYNPWAVLQRGRAALAGGDTCPSPPIRGRGMKKRERLPNVRGPVDYRPPVKPPPRVESTQPRETSPEPSSGEETAGENFEVRPYDAQANHVNGFDNDDGEWIDEDDEGEEDDLLDLEFHTTYVSNTEKRRKRWDTRWEALVREFQALDRQTDATMILMAAPSHSKNFHALTSRSIRRDPNLLGSSAYSRMRSSFREIGSRRRASRTQATSLVERLSLFAKDQVDGPGSPSSTGSREEDLRRVLNAALGSLGALGKMYEQRELRWREEMARLNEEREGVEVLLSQTLGSGGITEVGRAL